MSLIYGNSHLLRSVSKLFSINYLIPFFIALALLLSISTHLRFGSSLVGPGELMLSVLALFGFLTCRNLINVLTSLVGLFWVFLILGITIGWMQADLLAYKANEYMAAYFYNAIVSLGLYSLLLNMHNVMLKRIVLYLSILASLQLWVGFFVYLFADKSIAIFLAMSDWGDLRYSGWSNNPNQLSLLFVPLPVWISAIWRDYVNPTRWQSFCYYLLIFLTLLMGLLVRSDGLLVVWFFELFVLFLLRFRWELKASRISLFIYSLIFIICISLVKVFAYGEVKTSINCTLKVFGEGHQTWYSECYDKKTFSSNEKFRIGYSDPIEKTNNRQKLWQHGLQSWLNSPWFGLGPGEHSWIWEDSNGKKLDTKESHNILIDLLSQGGVFSGVSWIVFVSYLLFISWRRRDSYTFSIVLMIIAFTIFHNTRQPYLWFTLVFSLEAVRRGLFVSLKN